MTDPTVGRKGGLYCYVMTPYDDAGNVNHDVLERYVNAAIDGGVDGLTCIASTCEGVYLTRDERFAVAETVCGAAAPDGCRSTSEWADSPRARWWSSQNRRSAAERPA